MNKELVYKVIYKYKEKYKISKMCDFFDVSRSGYYYWIKNKDKESKDIELIKLISECQQKVYNTYGYRRIKIWLNRTYNININSKRILRIMNTNGLLAKIRRPKGYKRNLDQLNKYNNILNRNFSADKPNQKWVTDITYINTEEGTLYLSMIRDLYDSFIVGYKYGTNQTFDIVSDTVKNAIKSQKATSGTLLHSDQGSQYTSNDYNKLIKEYKLNPSMSRRGNCYDNACAENFFGILKSEYINRFKPKTIREASEMVDEYIYFYNYERIQLKTSLTPYEVRCQAC